MEAALPIFVEQQRRITALEQEVRDLDESLAAREAKLQSLGAHASETCACSWDAPEHLCMHHSPQLTKAQQRISELERVLEDLYATVCGECPSLLEEDCGGDARLDSEVRELLKPRP